MWYKVGCNKGIKFRVKRRKGSESLKHTLEQGQVWGSLRGRVTFHCLYNCHIGSFVGR